LRKNNILNQSNHSWYFLTENATELMYLSLANESKKLMALKLESPLNKKEIDQTFEMVSEIQSDLNNQEIFKSKELLQAYIDKYSNHLLNNNEGKSK
jgi:hypothetical protein